MSSILAGSKETRRPWSAGQELARRRERIGWGQAEIGEVIAQWDVLPPEECARAVERVEAGLHVAPWVRWAVHEAVELAETETGAT